MSTQPEDTPSQPADTVWGNPPTAARTAQGGAVHNTASPPSTVSAADDGDRWLGWAFAVLFGAAVVFYAFPGGGARMSQIECWVAQTAREMVQTGDWITPYFSGEIRLHKTPGPYWLVAGLSTLFDVEIGPQLIRSINATFSLGVVAVLMAWGWSNLSPRIGVFIGATIAASLFSLYWSHQGSADTGVAFFCTAALALFWQADRAPLRTWARFWWWMAFYAAFGLGMLHKGPFPLPIVGIVIIFYFFAFRRWKLPLQAHLPIGLIVFALFWVPWYGAILSTHGDNAWNRWVVESVDRGTGEMANYQTQSGSIVFHLTVYLIDIAGFLLPWTLSLAAALVIPFQRRWGKRRSALLYLFLWGVGIWLFLTCFIGKENRYIVPALPPLAALLGAYFSEFFRTGQQRNETLVGLGVVFAWILLPIGVIGGGFALHYWAKQSTLDVWPELLYRYIPLGAVMLAGFWVAALLYWKRRETASFAAIAATMMLSWLWAWPMVAPLFLGQDTQYQFARTMRSMMSGEQLDDTFYMGSPDARIIYYGDFRIPRVVENLELLEKVEEYEEANPNASLKQIFKHRLEIVGEAVYRKLIADEPVWFVASLVDFDRFKEGLDEHEENLHEGYPPLYIWHVADVGKRKYKSILFSNVPPPEGTPPATIPAGG